MPVTLAAAGGARSRGPLRPRLAFALLLAGCGGATTREIIACDPACPAGFTCTADGCAPDTTLDLSFRTPPDRAGDCPWTCDGHAPYCDRASRQCVICLEDSHCPAGEVCRGVGGRKLCLAGCQDDARCGGGALRCCGGACVDTGGDPANCGACGATCVGGHSESCVGGACTTGTCATGWADCNGDQTDGCETNLRVDLQSCGACGTVCSFQNAVALCSGDCYLEACQAGFGDCDAVPDNGCEKSLTDDHDNCGACGHGCPSLPNANYECRAGHCELASCDKGWNDCDGDDTNGCETFLPSDEKNCGVCGNVCPLRAICKGGVCDCPPCSLQNAIPKCVAAQCAVASCALNFGDCDKEPQNGCEKPLDADAKNCGACGNVCPMGQVCLLGGCTCPACDRPHARTTCFDDVCLLDRCMPGWADCDKQLANGCESDVSGDATNCGACGKVCPNNTPYCRSSQCTDALTSCLEFAKAGVKVDGVYKIDPDGPLGPIKPTSVYCNMTWDGGGWALALVRKVDDGFPNVLGKSKTWDCLKSTEPPLAVDVESDTVLPWDLFAAIGPRDMMLMAGDRILKFMYERTNGQFVTNYRNLTERTCFDKTIGTSGDAPNTGTTRLGGFACGHTNDACVTTDVVKWKARDCAFRDGTNNQKDGQYCGGANCGTFGNCPGGFNTLPFGAPNCWWYGATNAFSTYKIGTCPLAAQAAWGNYQAGTLSGYYTLWIR